MSTSSLRGSLSISGGASLLFSPTPTPTSTIAPNALRATPNGTTGSFVAWADAPGAESYSVQRSPDGSSWTTVASAHPTGWTPAGTVATAPPYLDSGLSPGTTYHYRVAANAGGSTGAYSSPVSITTRPVSTLTSGADTRTLLQPSDFTYLGSFALPATVPFTDGACPSNGFNYGALAIRYVSGTPRLMSTAEFQASGTSGYGLYEVAIPADGDLATAAPWTTATVVKAWGNVWQGRGWHYYDAPAGWISNLPGGGTAWALRGIHWDATDGRLYFGYGSEYGTASATDDPTTGFVTLDDAGGTYAAYGPWRVGAPKRDEGGVVGIPAWFADAYLSGQRLAAGFGGSYSLITAGGGGFGPGLDSFAPPSPATYNPTLTLSIVGGTPTSGVIALQILGPTGGTSFADVLVPHNAATSDLVAAFDAVLGTGSVTATGGPLPGTPIAFQLATNCTFQSIDSAATTLDAGSAALSGSATDPFAPTLASTNLIASSGLGATGHRDTDYENRQPSLLSYGAVGAVSASGGVGGLPAVVLPNSSGGGCTQPIAGGTLQFVSGPGAGQDFLVLDQDAATRTITLASAWGTAPVEGSTIHCAWTGGCNANVHSAAAAGATTLSISGGPIAQFASGAFAGFNLYVPRGTGSLQGPIPIAAYSYDSGAGVGTLTLGSGLTAAVDTTSTVTIDGPQRMGAVRAASGDTVRLAASADPSSSYTGLGIDYYVKMISGAAAGEEHRIASYDGATRTATLDAAWSVTPSPGDAYMIRQPGFLTVAGEYDPATSRGYQAFFEVYHGSACWIDTGAKHGLLLGPLWSVGQTTYDCSMTDAEGFKHVLQCFDPADLAAVAQGSKQPDAVDSSWEWYPQIPGYTYPILAAAFGSTGDPPLINAPPQLPPGMAFDAATGRLYVQWPWGSGFGGGNQPPLVMVFQLS